jgi:asparagine synthase (glutamine-hydrolysing)
MNEATRHRGPDGSQIYESEGVTLGHNRLAIIDLTDAALQPMESADGRYIIVFNGEIYNYRELKALLIERGCVFTTESDTEVLIAAYATWGKGMLPRLRGMFAFGIWDTKTETLLLARDHMGIKPLYYQEKEGVLAFSSELSACMGNEDVLDETAVNLYFEFQYVPSPHSLIAGVHKLPPGYMLTHTAGKSVLERYYAPEEGLGIPERVSEPSSHDLYRDIDAAVARQLVSERPVGMFLSGGLDSSVVLHHMAEHTEHVRTYSVGFEMVDGANEYEKFNADAALAARTAQVYGARHTTFTLTLAHIRENLETMMGALDEPVANPTALSQYFLSEKVREDGTVVALGGDGGDELFLGYTRHRMLMATYYFQKLPNGVQSLLSLTHPRVAKLMTPLGAPFHVGIMANKEKSVTPVLRSGMHPYAYARSYFDERYGALQRAHHPAHAFMYVDRATWLPDESLHRSDRTSMAHGLEMRVPLIDLDVVTSADQIPVYKKVTPFEGKQFLRRAYRSHLPSYLFHQPKRGWISPGAKWLRDPEILETVTQILSPTYYDGLGTLYNWKAIQTLLTDHVERRTYALYPLWNLLALQIWARKHGVRYIAP